MEYLALIYGDGQAWDDASEEERSAMYAGYAKFSDDARAAGVLVGGAELASTTTATSVRVRDGKEVVTDGPYAEAKESLGGYFILECPSFDDALDWAGLIPGAEHGAIEVRPVYVDQGA